ncbi:hypothetical protein CC1G_11038 [Coprinopsis cinerea okayama7|uniref:Uncharacterized protein n=1 Tax=Coprinopsis cinerea (strain Okayama-7 / 130 / ATCC MYA-4618 / FGSC 9003) TaxID=240176 RepID=A8NIT5_COPC7|nr:hypothetical protein CC1G_11038 [Coprinopsis cinerea okayama7\|eukprot:XP_001834068.2 hypothetical protein CC1G_11038 [Coprinopsis cinerea okayama7\
MSSEATPCPESSLNSKMALDYIMNHASVEPEPPAKPSREKKRRTKASNASKSRRSAEGSHHNRNPQAFRWVCDGDGRISRPWYYCPNVNYIPANSNKDPTTQHDDLPPSIAKRLSSGFVHWKPKQPRQRRNATSSRTIGNDPEAEEAAMRTVVARGNERDAGGSAVDSDSAAQVLKLPEVVKAGTIWRRRTWSYEDESLNT